MPNNSCFVNLREPTLFWNDVRQREFWGFVILIIEYRYIIIIDTAQAVIEQFHTELFTHKVSRCRTQS